MEQTDKQLEIIDKVLDLLRIVYDDKEFNFDVTLPIIFRIGFQWIKEINMYHIMSDYERVSPLYSQSVKSQLDKKFQSIVLWESNYTSITNFRQELENDFSRFIFKQNKLNVIYTAADRILLRDYYIDLSFRLAKVKNDYIKVRELILLKLKGIEWVLPKTNNLEIINSKSFILAPSKKEEFFAIIAEMYEHQFFSTVSTELVTKHDVLTAFGNLMQIKPEELPILSAMPAITKLIATPVSGKSFPDYLLYQEKDKLATALKNEFSTEKGKSIRIMIEALIQHNPPLISIGNRGNKDLYNAIKDYFQREIGSYAGIFSSFNQNSITQNDIENFQIKIKHLISVIENGKTT